MSKLTYCTNVHPIKNFLDWKESIPFYCQKINAQFNTKLSPGMWFNGNFANEICTDYKILKLIKDELNKNQIGIFTLNAFPYGFFQDKIVKTKVYLPDWSSIQRLHYTCQCATILSQLMKDDFGTISTLPLGWKRDWENNFEIKKQESAHNIVQVLIHLKKIYETTGKRIMLCIEPEPGCVLERTDEVILFWENILIPTASKNQIDVNTLRQFCGLCYDTCHQAVQFEDAVEALNLIHKANIPIGKMQLSAAIEFKPDFEKKSIPIRNSFIEERFLHQTRQQINHQSHQIIPVNQNLGRTINTIDFDDLPIAIDKGDWSELWRVHYHLPLFIDDVFKNNDDTSYRSTVNEMKKALNWAIDNNYCEHFEIETYTWNVLPESLRPNSKEELATGIIKEFDYIMSLNMKGLEIA